MFIDAIMVKVRDDQVGNRPVYAAIGVDLDGNKDILGMWAPGVGGWYWSQDLVAHICKHAPGEPSAFAPEVSDRSSVR